MTKEQQNYYEKVEKQRAFLLAALCAFMELEFEGEDIQKFKLKVAISFHHEFFDNKNINVEDAMDMIFLKHLKEAFERQQAVNNLKDFLNNGGAL